MQVEEDPSSQFVDFTNATASEQFVSDVEQALIGWQLANKGHASLEALTAAAQGGGGAKKASSPTLDAAVWTNELQYQPPGQSAAYKSYSLSLFVARQQESAPRAAEDPPRASRKLKKWQEGLEHFTPTMLSVADASRDFQWGVDGETESEEEPDEAEETTERTASYYTSVFEDDGEPVFSRRTVFKSVQKWFGMDEFLLLSRSSPREKKHKVGLVKGTATEAEDVRVGYNEEKLNAESENDVGKNMDAQDEGEEKDEEDEDAMADIHVDQNEAGMLLSALTMALNSCNCTIPAFVPVFEPSKGTWIGSAVPGATGNVSMSFDTDSVPELNPNQSCISGLLDFFKVKLQLPPHIEERCRVEADESGDLAIGMMVSASFGYTWNRAEDPREAVNPENPLAWRTLESQLPAKEQHQIHQITKKLFGENHPTLLLGTSTSPLDGMDLTISWPQLREGTYVDNVVHSTLDPSSAPQWMLSVRFRNLLAENQRKPQLPLSKRLANLVQVYSNSRELNKDILVSELAPPMPVAPSSKPSVTHPAPSATGSSEAAAAHPSASIPESIPAARAAVVLGNAISSLVSAATWKGSDVEEIRRILSELFDEENEEGGNGDETGEQNGDLKPSARDLLATMPSSIQHGAPLGELVSVLATRMSQLHSINYMSLLWVEFVKALRERWFQQQLVPFMSTSTKEGGVDHNTSSRSLDALFLLDADAVQLPPPDFRHCLLHQKLQLLNCCILREAQELRPASNARGGIMTSRSGQNISEGVGTHNAVVSNEDELECEAADGSPSDDEFFDSIELDSAPLPSSPRVARGPEGVLREAPGVVCLQTNDTLLEPVTQTAVPMTEDVAKQQQDLLTRLGVSVESDKLRQQIQSTALISDMQAFKAANPRSCLADFIRWYSPKDWIPFKTAVDPMHTDLPLEGRGVWWFELHGMLSERMRFGPGHEHLWQQMWETSAAMSVNRQKRLFDPLQESEKVYHYMETLSPHELFHQMLAGAISSSIFALETALPVNVSADTLPVVDRALQKLRLRGNRAIALMDEALAESQVAFPAAGRSKTQRGGVHEQSIAAAHQGQQLQVAFEMALDACWKLVRTLEVVEALTTKALALLRYFPASNEDQSSLALVNFLLLPSISHRQQVEISELLKREYLRQHVTMLVLTNPSLAGVGPMTLPIQREYVLRCICPRPFLREYYGDSAFEDEDNEASGIQPEQEREESPLVACRMYAAFKKSTVRFALVLAESEF